jgi:hypothetical protein
VESSFQRDLRSAVLEGRQNDKTLLAHQDDTSVVFPQPISSWYLSVNPFQCRLTALNNDVPRNWNADSDSEPLWSDFQERAKRAKRQATPSLGDCELCGLDDHWSALSCASMRRRKRAGNTCPFNRIPLASRDQHAVCSSRSEFYCTA